MMKCRHTRWSIWCILVLFTIFFIVLWYQKTQLHTSVIWFNAEWHRALLESEKNAFLKTIDTQSDNSIQKFVNNKISFDDVGYVPEELVALEWEYIYDSKSNSRIRSDMSEALQDMSADFFDVFDTQLVVVSAYRSYLYQKWIKDRGCPDNLCAKAGYSEHQSGLAVDFFSASSQSVWLNSTKLSGYYDWLSRHAHTYGFHNTYQRGVEVDGYEIEPWHWRYVWVPLAHYLWEKDITFAEWYYSIEWQ